jgi:hypothetical protein
LVSFFIFQFHLLLIMKLKRRASQSPAEIDAMQEDPPIQGKYTEATPAEQTAATSTKETFGRWYKRLRLLFGAGEGDEGEVVDGATTETTESAPQSAASLPTVTPAKREISPVRKASPSLTQSSTLSAAATTTLPPAKPFALPTLRRMVRQIVQTI